RDLPTGRSATTLITSTVEPARTLGLDVVAERVETDEQWQAGAPAVERRDGVAAGWGRSEVGQRSTFSFSPPSMRSPVSFAFAKLKTVARRPPGLSQYSAESACTFSSTTLSSSGPWGNQASTALFHSSRFF